MKVNKILSLALSSQKNSTSRQAAKSIFLHEFEFLYKIAVVHESGDPEVPLKKLFFLNKTNENNTAGLFLNGLKYTVL
jgi:hypothetical protein